MIKNELENIEGRILIYGARLVAYECARALIQIGKRENIIGFAVTNIHGNPDEIERIPVKMFEEYSIPTQNVTVIIATPEKYFNEIEGYVKSKGFNKILKVGLEDMSKLKGRRLLSLQKDYLDLPFVLEQDRNDHSWLNMYEKQYFGTNETQNEKNSHYKFPTLFYLEEKKVFQEAIRLDFQGDYEKICGQYRNIHGLSDAADLSINENDLKKYINIYMAFSVWDSAKTNVRQYPPWICPIQLGSGLSDQRYGTCFDDTGDNISRQNGIFAEMTGVYWIWKNVERTKYKGLCHYRRHFMISEEEIMALEQQGIDVILTTPRYVPGGIKNMFLAETPVKQEVYVGMLNAISELAIEDRKAFEDYMDSCFYYPNNMVIARNEIYNSYCAWIFPILFRMWESDRENGYGHESDRHIAYAAELLTSYFFVKNREKYYITVTDYQFFS